MALSQNNKYGSLEDLLNVLRALHKDGIQAIADWVPDQIYNLPGKEVVNATRVNGYGYHQAGYQIVDQAYVANTRTDGTDYQGKYGGAFLDELKAKYPSIFNRVQISNGLLSTSTEPTFLDEASTLSFVMIRPTSTSILQPTANSCQHHFVTQVPSQALKSSNVVDKMFTSFVITKPLRMNLFKTVTATGITSVLTVR